MDQTPSRPVGAAWLVFSVIAHVRLTDGLYVYHLITLPQLSQHQPILNEHFPGQTAKSSTLHVQSDTSTHSHLLLLAVMQ
jgi:hypothetical protein